MPYIGLLPMDKHQKEEFVFRLTTTRLVIVATPLAVVEQRLTQETFDAIVPIGEESGHVHFPAEWPGDALVLFPMMVANHNPEGWGGTVVNRVERVAVGQIGTKGEPDEAGRIEIGYGINPAYWGHGYATEAVGALVAFLQAQASVRTIIAETRTDNAASIRVLEKLGFVRDGERFDEEDGPLFVWKLSA